MTEIGNAVSEVILELARRDNASLEALQPEQHLIRDLGLDSLDITELVVTIEMRLKLNPFSSGLSIDDFPTVGSFCDAYRRTGTA